MREVQPRRVYDTRERGRHMRAVRAGPKAKEEGQAVSPDQVVPTLALAAIIIGLWCELILGVWYPRRWNWLLRILRRDQI